MKHSLRDVARMLVSILLSAAHSVVPANCPAAAVAEPADQFDVTPHYKQSYSPFVPYRRQ